MIFPKRTPAVIMALIVGLVIILLVVSNVLIDHTFTELEREQARRDMARLKSVYDHELSSLFALTADWAHWDDTYDFVEDRNAAYVSVNYVDETFENLELSLAVMTDRSGAIVFSKGFDLAAGQETEIPTEMQPDVLARIAEPVDGQTGILSTSEGLLLVAAQPILTSDRSGPRNGTLFFGRSVDRTMLERFRALTQNDISFVAGDDDSRPADFEMARREISDGAPVFVHVIDSNQIAAYAQLDDLFGSPVGIIRIVDTREAYQHSLSSRILFTGLILFLTGVCALIIALLITRMRRAGVGLSDILNNSSDPIAVVRHDGTILQSNSTFQAVCGNKTTAILDIVRPEQRDEFSRQLAGVADRRALPRLRNVSILLQLAFGDRREYEALLSPFPTRSRSDQRVIVTFHDISVQKSMEQHLRNALEREIELNDLKTKSLSMASHEFRTPLAVILSSVEILERYSDRLSDGDKDKHFSKIRNSVQTMRELTDDVLTHIRAETGRLEVHPEPLDMNALCGTIIEEITPPNGKAPRIAFSPSTYTRPVEVDPSITTLVVRNLLSNAVKYTPAGKLVQIALSQNAQQTTLTVQDEGVGIPAEEQARLFTPFFRASNVGDTPGNGLGLSIVKQAVELHGGSISLDSTPGEGTTFRVTLPHIPASQDGREAAAAPARPGA